MSISYSKAGRRCLIAVAVASLSACSTAPRMPDDLNNIGQGLVNAGKSTADFSRRAWDKTSYLLGFTDEEPERDAATQQDLPRQPLAQRQRIPESPAVANGTMPDAQWVDSQTLSRDSQVLSASQRAARPESARQNPAPETVGGFEPVQSRADLRYTVNSNENLWNIAKVTTGDATNWHLLADINNLAPNAGVFPGQTLIIPADMVKPGYMPGLMADSELKDAVINDAVQVSAETGATGVSGINTDTNENSQRLEISGQPFELKHGETLWDLAKRTTGDAMNWELIAMHNHLSAEESTLVYAGQTIYIPETLLLDTNSADELIGRALEQPTQSVDETASNQRSSLLDETSSLVFDDQKGPTTQGLDASTPEPVFSAGRAEPIGALASLSVPGKAGESMAINSVPALQIAEHSADKRIDQGGPELAMLERQSNDPVRMEPAVSDAAERTAVVSKPATTSRAHSNFPNEVLVSGSYYPKAVYNEADFSSSLLMRVSPGTRLQVSDAFGTWYQVVTEKGTGYVHQRDIR